MKLMKIIRIVGFITFLSLIYIHLQTQIFDLAYQGKNREKHIRQLNEINGSTTYSILKLKSANNLGYKLLAENSDLKFRDYSQVVRIESPQQDKAESSVSLSSASKSTVNSILNLFSLRSQAEAQPQE